MNEIKRIRIVIEADEWEPFRRACQQDLDKMLGLLKEKELLKHYGNVKTVYTEGV